MKLLPRPLALLAAVALSACSAPGGDSGPVAPDASPVARLDVQPRHSWLALLSPHDAGRSRQLQASAWDGRQRLLPDAGVTWTSESDAVQVDRAGRITLARIGGPMRVRAAAGGVSAEALVCPVVFRNDLEQADPGPLSRDGLSAGWNTPPYVYGMDRVAVVDGPEAYGGGRSLRVFYPGGSVGPGQGGTIFNVPLGATYHDLHLSYMVRFGPGFDFVLGGKLPGLAGGTGNTGGVRPTGRDGWSARGMWTQGGRMIQYVYHPDQTGAFATSYPWKRRGRDLLVVPDRWYHVEHRVVMNTPGVKDGMIQAWIDGELVLEAHGMRFRDVDTFGIDMVQFSTFFGGNQPAHAARRDEYVYFDNVVVSTFRVGPPGADGTTDCRVDTPDPSGAPGPVDDF